MTSAAQHTAAVQNSATPKPPILLLVNPHKRHRAKTGRSEKGKWESLLEEKHRKGKRGEKWDRKTRRVQGLLSRSRNNFTYNFMYALLCLPVSARLCAHAHGSLRVLMFPSCVPPPNNISFKATAKNLPAPPSRPPSHYPLCSPFTPTKKKLLITRQRSVIKTHVYTRVSFMDQDLVWGGADTWAQCQPCRAASNRRLFPLPFSGTECCAHLVEAKKTANNAAIQHVISLLPCNRNSVIWRHFEIGQIKAALCTSEWRDRWLKGYVLSELPTRIRVFMHVRGNGEAHLFADGSNGH